VYFSEVIKRANRLDKLLTPMSTYLVSLGLTLIISLYHGFKSVSPLDPSPINGTHQLYMAVSRLLSSDTLGSDYVVFHGPTWGLPFLPVYLLTNGNIFALEFAKYFLNVLALPAITGYFVFNFTRNTKFSRLSILTVMFVPYLSKFNALFTFLPYSALNREVLALASSAGIRFSVCFISILVFLRARQGNPHERIALYVWSGFVFGFATDQAVYFTLSTLIVILILHYLDGDNRELLQHLTFLLNSWAAWLLIVFLLAHGSINATFETLKFYFVYLPSDQRWFFATWPAAIITSWRELFFLVSPFLTISLLIILLSLKKIRKKIEFSEKNLAILILSFFSVFSTLPLLMSYKGMHYLIPTTLSILTCALLLFEFDKQKSNPEKLVKKKSKNQKTKEVYNLSPNPPRDKKMITKWLVGATLSATIIPALVFSLQRNSTSLNWEKDMASYLSLSVNCQEKTNFWSDYPGYFSIKSGCKQPVGDLMIHALGDRREKYSQSFSKEKPIFVETSTREANPWMPWLRATNWDFYRNLYTNYSPIGESSHSIIWRLDSEKKQKLKPKGQSNFSEVLFPIPTTLSPPKGTDVGYVTIFYEVIQPLKQFPMLGELGTFALKVDGSVYPGEVVSLPSSSSRLEFPIYISKDASVVSVTPVYNSPRFFSALRVQKIKINWFEVLPDEKENFEKSLK